MSKKHIGREPATDVFTEKVETETTTTINLRPLIAALIAAGFLFRSGGFTASQENIKLITDWVDKLENI